VKIVKEPKNTKYYAIKLSQIRRRIEIRMREIFLSEEIKQRAWVKIFINWPENFENII
jgi:hypothetical protein